jgi:O-antigen ligase
MISPLFIDSKIKLKTIIETIIASVLFQIFLVFLQKINNGTLGIYIESFMLKEEFGIRSNENIDILRLTGSFFEPSILGTFLLVNFSLLLNSLKKLKNNKTKKLILFTLLCSFIGIILTASRGIYLLFFAYIIFELFLESKGRNIKFKKINRNLIIIIITIITVLLPYFSNRVFDFSKIFSKLGSGTYRLQLAEQAYLLAKNNLLGVGLNLSPYSFAIQKFSKEIIFDPAHPHNIFFQILAETGFLGLIIFSLYIFYTLKEVPNLNKNLFFYPVVLFLIAAQFYPIFINQSEITSYFFLFIGLSRKSIKS